MEASTFITEAQPILLWGIALGVVAGAIYLEQRYKAMAYAGSLILVLVGAFALSNLRVIPFESAIYAGINDIILLCAIPLLLFKVNIKEIIQNSGKLFFLFHVAAIGSSIGVLVSFAIFGRMEDVPGILTALAASSVGGTVNFVAMVSMYEINMAAIAPILVLGNFLIILLFLILRLMGSSGIIKKNFKMPLTEELERSIDKEELEKSGKTTAAVFWGGKEIGLKDIAMALGITFLIVGISQAVADWVISINPPNIIQQLFGSVFMIMTLFTVLLGTLFPKFLGSIRGTNELGTIGMLLWFFTIGASGDLIAIIQSAAFILAIAAILYAVNIIVTCIGAKLVKSTWEETASAIMATLGGPPTVASFLISQGWYKLVIPAILVSLWGFVIGNYFGIAAANIFGVLPR